ncbi:hypothetical protein [Brucella intermedia]|uniref:hypothetical protein n=1 Tax=Brucella intermedia TaxID=94625 RepID=UPI0013B00CF9|nr:hypothetical protein [Brucella intermedia]
MNQRSGFDSTARTFIRLFSLAGVALSKVRSGIPDMSGFNAILPGNDARKGSYPSKMFAILNAGALLPLRWGQ